MWDNHLDFHVLAGLLVIFGDIHCVVEREIHRCGIVAIHLKDQVVLLPLCGTVTVHLIGRNYGPVHPIDACGSGSPERRHRAVASE
jgi:hypothetical protein